MDPTLVPMIAGGFVFALLVGGWFVLGKSPASEAEERLDELSGHRRKPGKLADSGTGPSLLKTPAVELGKSRAWFDRFLSIDGLNQLYEQADVGMPFPYFLGIAAALATAGAVIALALKLDVYVAPLCAAGLGVLPFFWLVLRKRKRIKKFTAQMPDALELVGRALRAGHSLASGLNIVADEMPAPISLEFSRVFEEQNLGVPIEESLRALAERVPTMDVRFFVTAVVIQRATGGDLAEVLDKIGRLIRERYQIMGAVQALTGEGRLSGAVLLAMPPALLAYIYMVNPEYANLLFTTAIGKKMLLVAGVLQILGAVAIKKIVTIKV